VHRVGRTGRAGRSGEAILFIAPRERGLLRAIEQATRQKIEPMDLPSVDAVNASRIAKFKVRISETVAKGRAAEFRPILRELETETGMSLIDIAAALASLGQGESPLLLKGAETFRPDERSQGESKPVRGTQQPARGIQPGRKPAPGMHPARDAAQGGGNRKFRRRARP
jgi:ATP-dependent RNA helicase DeaD